MSSSDSFPAFRIHNDSDRLPRRHRVDAAPTTSRPAKCWSRSPTRRVNYKDALAGTGKGKILRKFPLNGGIDVAGYVAASTDPALQGRRPGALHRLRPQRDARRRLRRIRAARSRSGRFRCRRARRCANRWSLGTAGFTAALALFQMTRNGQTPEMGPIVVTGATGGVGSLAIDILTRAGFEAHAITGKVEHFDYLNALGAQQCIARTELYWGQRPLENAHWAGAIDNVGGDMLAGPDARHQAVRQRRDLRQRRRHRAADDGDAVHHPRRQPARRRVGRHRARHPRSQSGQHLAGDWKPVHLDRSRRSEVALDDLAGVFDDDARRRLARPHGRARRLKTIRRNATPAG